MPAEVRAVLETVIEELIGLLDAVDGDSDLEADELESDRDDEDYDVVIAA